MSEKYRNNLKFQTGLTDVKSLKKIWLGWRDSNPRMHGPKPCALPLGHIPSTFFRRCNDQQILP
jgi:hypothetical protein